MFPVLSNPPFKGASTMPVHVKKPANLLSQGACILGCVSFALILALGGTAAHAGDEPPTAGLAVPGNPESVAPGDVPSGADGVDLDQERIALSREVRSLHQEWVKARAEAERTDPEIGRLRKQAKDLEAELARIRAEVESRLDQLPPLSRLKAELEEAQARLRELNRQVRPAGPRGRRTVRRKPDETPAVARGGKAAVEEIQKGAGTAEAADGAGE